MSGTKSEPNQSMTVTDAFFESASGFSGTGATVLTNVEDRELVPRAILFWRSETHFLGGLGIMVLFVAILGQGSAGKTLMRTEMPGPDKETGQSRTQHAAWAFTSVYLGLIVVLVVILLLQGVSLFDSLCHAFGTIATGGFSTYNDSVAHFGSVGVEMTIAVFMVLACTNFTLLYLLLLRRPKSLLADVEFRAYLLVLAGATALVVGSCLYYGDYGGWAGSLRYGFFQVASILTNTGFATDNFDEWNEIGRGTLFVLMFIGGCAGSTSCSVKIIRYVLLFKVIGHELEHAYHPTVVRPFTLGGKNIDQEGIRRQVLVYFCLLLIIFVSSWLALDFFEPDAAWSRLGHTRHEKLMDLASGVGATLNGVGPGLGTIGAVENYSHFQPESKLIFVLLMLLGRLELYAILVLFRPRFWRGLS
jgi:trk system potassium uptake protein TrkH